MSNNWGVPIRDWSRYVPGIVERAHEGDTLIVRTREALAFVSTFVGNSGKSLHVVLRDERVAVDTERSETHDE